jgi:predicted transcriptional regulator
MHWEYFTYGIRKKWEESRLRKWAIENPVKVFKLAGVSFIFLLIAIVYVLIPAAQPIMHEPELAWYYDMNTGKLFKAEARLLPPIEAPSGPDANGLPAGVKAFVYKYIGDANSKPFLAFLQTTAPGKKEIVEQILRSEKSESQESANKIQSLTLVKRVKDKKWYPADSGEGVYVMMDKMVKNGQRAVYYPPKHSRNESPGE